MQAQFHVIRSAWSSWQSLFQDAADFMSQVGPQRLIGLSHSEDHNEGVVTLWYWDEPISRQAGPPLRAAFEVFRGTLASWQALFRDAADFVSRAGPHRVIGVSHSEDKNEGVVTVWYWTS